MRKFQTSIHNMSITVNEKWLMVLPSNLVRGIVSISSFKSKTNHPISSNNHRK